MKKIMTLMASFLFTIGISIAQIGPIPAKVTEAFKAKYPNSTEVKWTGKLTRFTVTFIHNGEKLKANFNDDGAWKDTQMPVSVESIPAAVRSGLSRSDYKDWTIEEVTRIDADGRERMYKIEVKKNAADQKNLFFNEKGELLRDARTL